MATAATENNVGLWGGGNKPLNASYGKMMMWFFIVSDALTFSGFLVSYGFSRFKGIDSWPIADEVFTHFPFFTRCGSTYVLCCFYDFCPHRFVCDHGAGCRCGTPHEQKKSNYLHAVDDCWRINFCGVSSMGVENIY